MTTLNIQAAQNDIIRQVLNTQDIHLLDRIKNLFANKEANEACMVQEEPCMTKEEILSGFDNALHELKSYREGKLELKRLNKRYKSFKSDLKELMNELSFSPSLGADLGGGLRKVRMAIKSKGTGKSGGARIITVVLADIEDGLGLLYIYDKSERSTIKGKELTDLLKKNGLV